MNVENSQLIELAHTKIVKPLPIMATFLQHWRSNKVVRTKYPKEKKNCPKLGIFFNQT
jgi:hypothetical protein